MLITGLILIAAGIAVLVGGTRLWLIGGAAGALLGLGLLRLLPGTQDGFVGVAIVVGLAVLFGVLAMFGKGFISLIVMAIGFIAGVAIATALFDMLNLNLGLIGWIVALIAGFVAAGFAMRVQGWALIILSALVGALLVLRGAQLIVPSLDGTIATVIAIVVAGGGIFYHARGGVKK